MLHCKKIKYFFTIFICLFLTLVTQGQTVASNPIEIITEESAGKISIEIPETLQSIIFKANSKPSKEKSGINKTTGYRIQVFCEGGSQYSLESRARERGNVILGKFPKYKGQIYTFSKSPNWYTRIGNFKTLGEANSALAELKRAFPSYASEMRIVKSQIVVIKP